jgi:hypothetical protein
MGEEMVNVCLSYVFLASQVKKFEIKHFFVSICMKVKKVGVYLLRIKELPFSKVLFSSLVTKHGFIVRR